MKLIHLGFGWPVAATPYYYLRIGIEDEFINPWGVSRVLVNGKRNRDFEAINDGRSVVPAMFLPGMTSRELYIRVDWQNGDTFHVEVMLICGEETQNVSDDFTAKEENGYWDKAWKYYGTHVLTETAGIERIQEPVHAVLGMYMDRVNDPEKELRVVSIDPLSGKAEEIRSQVYSVTKWNRWQDIHCQPTTTAQVAFLADVRAYESRVFLFFYGNPVSEKPCYPSDLILEGEGYGLTIHNVYYTVNLHKDSGSIDEIIPKVHPELVYCHHLETNGALQWNPGVYAPPKTWMHSSDWVKPENFTVIAGPVFVMIKRFNPIPDYNEVDCSLTYIFHSNNSGITVESNIDITKDLDVVALRNGSVVLNKETTGDFVWKDVDHQVKTVHIQDLPRHPVKGKILDAHTPWFAFYNRSKGNALGVLNLDFMGVRRSDGLIEWEPHYYLHWGPWYYVSRPIIYTFTSNNPQRVMHMAAGSSFYERYMFLPFEVCMGKKDHDGFDTIDSAYKKANEPLSKNLVKYDTDDRVPDEWIPPILVNEFKETDD